MLQPPACSLGVGDISPVGSAYGSIGSDSLGLHGINTPGSVSSSAPAPRHKFFDSVPQPLGRPAAPSRPSTAVLTNASNLTLQRPITPIIQEKKPTAGLKVNGDKNAHEDEPRLLSVPAENVVQSAHYGYIYCMALVRDDVGEEARLVTGSGDEDTKVCPSFLASFRYS